VVVTDLVHAIKGYHRMRSFFREPLLHFLLLGFLLFVAYDFMHGNRAASGNRIVVDDSVVADIVQRHTAIWQREPSPQELQGLIDTYIRDEALYREGVAMGLQENDIVIQRRVRQKLEVMAEESGQQASATDADLLAYLSQHAERYALPAELSFEQVYFDPSRHGEKLDADIASARATLTSGSDSANIGDNTLLPQRVERALATDIARDFGEDFASALMSLPPGSWQGPVASAFGVHLVRVVEHIDGRSANLADVRAAVERDWEHDRRVAAREAFYHNARTHYDIRITTSPDGAVNSSAVDKSKVISK
jgi:hypothetical protein